MDLPHSSLNVSKGKVNLNYSHVYLKQTLLNISGRRVSSFLMICHQVELDYLASVELFYVDLVFPYIDSPPVLPLTVR